MRNRIFNAKALAKRCKITQGAAHKFLDSFPSLVAMSLYVMDHDYRNERVLPHRYKVYRREGRATTAEELLKMYRVNKATVSKHVLMWAEKKITWKELHEFLLLTEQTSKPANRGNWGDLSDRPRPWNLLDMAGDNDTDPSTAMEDEREYFKRIGS